MWKFIGVIALCLGACATAPKSSSGRQDLVGQAQITAREMMNADPTLQGLLSRSAGYVVFPNIGKGGFVVGGAYGRGILWEGGRFAGYVELNQGSVGLQAGAQSFSQLVVLLTPTAVERLKQGSFSIGAEISAVVLTTGAAAATDFRKDMAVFVKPQGGVMAGISVSGQQLNFDEG